MNIAIVSFTRKGGALATMIQERLEPLSISCFGYIIPKYTPDFISLRPLTSSIQEWTKEQFLNMDAIVFVSACGIAVRAIAPFIKDKRTDPAVIVMDEGSNFCISLLSGHIGGANELTTLISKVTNSTPVITTATDINHQFSVDVFAVKNDLIIDDMTLAKEISSSILDGNKVGLVSDFNLDASIPEQLKYYDIQDYNKIQDNTMNQCDLGICITLYPLQKKPFKNTLYLIPRILSIGIGCKKDTPFSVIEEYIYTTILEQGLSLECIKNIGSIDIKAKEPGILAFAEKHNLPFLTFTPNEMNALPGDFQESDFVKSITGVGNVCERAAILSSNHGQLILKKQAKDGVTLALSYCNRRITF